MNMFTSWKQSVAILYPKNLKNIILVTINAVMCVYRELLLASVAISALLVVSMPRMWAVLEAHFFPLVYWIVAELLLGVKKYTSPAVVWGINLDVLRQLMGWVIVDLLLIMTIAFVAIMVRPSVFLKDMSYQGRYCEKFAGRLITGIALVHVVWLCISGVFSYLLYSFEINQSCVHYISYFLLMPPAFMVEHGPVGWAFAAALLQAPIGILFNYWPLYIFLFFFILDGCSMHRSVRNALVLVLYNYPFLLVVRSFFAGITYALSYGLTYVQPQSQYAYLVFTACVAGFIMMPLGYALMSVIYTKRVHDTPELFMS